MIEVGPSCLKKNDFKRSLVHNIIFQSITIFNVSKIIYLLCISKLSVFQDYIYCKIKNEISRHSFYHRHVICL